VLAGFVGFAFFGRPWAKTSAHAPVSAHLVVIGSSAEFDTEVLKATGPVLVDFYADWCGPCQRLLPVMSELADEWAGAVKVVKVNVDKAGEVAKTYGVSSIPDVRIFVGGQEKDRLIGLKSKDVYVARMAPWRAAAPTPTPVPKAE
jgi:thioredoxin